MQDFVNFYCKFLYVSMMYWYWVVTLCDYPPLQNFSKAPTFDYIFVDNIVPMIYGVNTINSWEKVISSCFED